jgi:hypothetical protein
VSFGEENTLGTSDKVSVQPKATRRRLRQKSEQLERQILADIERVYQKPVSEWDWEELSKGRPREEDGTFSRGGKPAWITPAITAEVQRRMREMTEQELMTHSLDAIRSLTDLLSNQEIDDFGKPIVSASVKLQAAMYIINQTIGTPRAKVEVTQSSPIENFLADVLVNPDGEASHHMVIDGRLVGDQEDDDSGGE